MFNSNNSTDDSSLKTRGGRVQIIEVDCSWTKNQFDVEPSQSLVSTIAGLNIQYGSSCKQQKYTDKSFESLELADVII